MNISASLVCRFTLLCLGAASSAFAQDTIPPTVPGSAKINYDTAITPATSRTKMTLTWNASTDAVGVTGYQIYRDHTFLASVGGTILTYSDNGLNPLTTYTYTIRAVDAANNMSAFTGELRGAAADGTSADFEGLSPLLEQTTPLADGVSLEYRRFKPLGFDDPANSTRKYPVVMFLHGIGECGLNNADQLSNRANGAMCFVTVRNQMTNPCFMIAPQCPTYVNSNGNTVERTWKATDRQQQIRNIILGLSTLYPGRIDNTRYYLVGLSYGSLGTWYGISAAPNFFAAAVPLCGDGNGTASNNVHLPIWTFHCVDDDMVTMAKTQEMVFAMRQLGGNPNFGYYTSGGHSGGWTKAFNDPGMVEWLMAQRRETGGYEGTTIVTNPPAPNGRACHIRRVPSVTITAPTRDNFFKTAATSVTLTAQIGSAKAKIKEVAWWNSTIGATMSGTDGATTVNVKSFTSATGGFTTALIGSVVHVNDIIVGKITAVPNSTTLTLSTAPEDSSTGKAFDILPPGHLYNPQTVTLAATNQTYLEQTITVPLTSNMNNTIGIVAKDAADSYFSDTADTYFGDTIVVDQEAVPTALLSANAGSYPHQYGAANVVLNLDGTVLDNNVPVTTGVTWSQLDGPANVTFGNANAVDTTVTFPVTGTYRLKLNAVNGTRIASDVVQINVYPSQPTLLDTLVYAIDAGGAWYTTPDGIDYTTDAKPGQNILTGTSSVDAYFREARGTDDDVIYRTVRSGASFGYALPVTNGMYDIKLKFADFVSTAAGQRRFNVKMEGVDKVTGLDLYQSVGLDRAHDVTISGINVTDGTLNIDFIGVAGNACVSGIVVTESPVAPGYFEQYFSDGSNINAGGPYVASSQTVQEANKFNHLAGETAAETWTVVNGALVLDRSTSSTNGAGFTRVSPTTNIPSVMDCRFKVSVDYTTTTNTFSDIATLDLGNFTGYADYNNSSISSAVGNRLVIKGAGSGGYKFYINTSYVTGTTGTTGNYGEGPTMLDIRWVVNQSGAPKEYWTGTSNRTLGSGYSDLWINGSLILSDVPRVSSISGTQLGGMRFRTSIGLEVNITLDDMVFYSDTLVDP